MGALGAPADWRALSLEYPRVRYLAGLFWRLRCKWGLLHK